LDYLDAICQGIEAFIADGVKEGFGSSTTTTAFCTLGESRRSLVAERSSFLTYEKPVVVTVLSTFANYKEAPRKFGFEYFLEGLMVSEDAQNELPNYIQEALGDSAGVRGVNITSVESAGQPALVLALEPDGPTASPTAILRSGELSPSANAISMAIASISGGMMMMMML